MKKGTKMKKIQKKTKLSLTAETIKQLDDRQMASVAGGWTNTCLGTACFCLPTYQATCGQGCTAGLCASNGASCNFC